MLDPFSGPATQLRVYFPHTGESFIKSLSVVNARSRARYSTVKDTTEALHYYSLYNVPFSRDQGLEEAVRWNYSLVRLASANLDNLHVLQVTSAPAVHQDLRVSLTTNLRPQEHLSAHLSPESPLILYAEVKLNQRPVLNARVVAELQGVNRAGLAIPASQVVLLDSGTGDPDMFALDGVYSRYFTDILEEGLYTVTVHVSSSSESPAGYATGSSVSTLPEFSRIVSGFSFRVETLQRSSKDSFPPSRIGDLGVSEMTGSSELELAWTSPGDDYDTGAPSSYQLYYSQDPASFYLDEAPPPQLVERFTGDLPAGQPDRHRINVQAYNKNLYYALVAVDDQGNTGRLSNIVRAYVPQQFVMHQAGQSAGSNGQLREGLFNPFQAIKEPNKIIMYVVVGVVTVVIFTFLVVTMIMIISRRLTKPVEQDGHDLTAESGGFKDSDLLRFSIDHNINGFEHKPSSTDKYILSETRLDPYGEVGDSHHHQAPFASSEDKLFPRDNFIYKDSMESFRDPYASSSDTFSSPIYSKPVPKNQRQTTATTNPTNHSPVKSILKKPRGEADGVEAESIYASRRNYSPPPLPSPLLTLDITQHSSATLPPPPPLPETAAKGCSTAALATGCSNPDLVVDSSMKIRNCTQV